MKDIVLEKMKKEQIPMSRDNYLTMAYFGTPPDHLSAEEESALPEEFRQTPDESQDEDTEDSEESQA